MAPARKTSKLQHFLTIGRSDFSGPAFRDPVAVAVNRSGIIYVVSHSYEFRPDGKRITKCTLEEDFLGQFGHGGDEPGQFVWPSALAIDQAQNVFLSDQFLNRISIFSESGEYQHHWGKSGTGDGELDRPSGIVFDPTGNLVIVDSNNHRVQRFTPNGVFINQFGTYGSDEGQLDTPWGMAADTQGNIYVADWRNDRIQKFDINGRFLMQFGGSGSADGKFNRPSGVAVDQDGDIYVTDWKNNRLQWFDQNGAHLGSYYGAATVSKWATIKLQANPDMMEMREQDCGLDREKLFNAPVAVTVDAEGRIYVLETLRHRLQIYTKG